MGEIADLMINGDICEGCGCELDGEGDGFPRRCSDCGGRTRDFEPSQAKKQPAQQLSKKQLQKLEWATAKSSMYEGCNWDEAPGQFNRLEQMGLVSCVQPHNPAHKAKAVLTAAGRAALKASKGGSVNASTEKPRPVDSLTDLEERLSLWCQFREPLPLVKYASVAELLSASLFYIREQRQSFAALSKHNEALKEALEFEKGSSTRLVQWNEKLAEQVTGLVAALEEALEYFEDREDVRDGPSGEQLPNTEMSMAQALRAALALSRGGGT